MPRTIEVWYAEQLVQTLPRLRGQDKHRIDYRHIIDWLVRKPGAFARYRYRADLFPTVPFRLAYDALAWRSSRAVRTRSTCGSCTWRRRRARRGSRRRWRKLLDQRRPLSAQAVRTLLGSDTPLSRGGPGGGAGGGPAVSTTRCWKATSDARQ